MEDYQDRIRRILIVRLSAIGDIILTLPVAQALRERFPAARIDYLVKREYLDLLSRHPAISRVWSFEKEGGYDELRRFAQQIHDARYDLMVDLHQNPRSIYLRIFGGAFMTRGYRKRITDRLLLKWFNLNRLKDAPPVADRYFTALEDFGITRDGRRPKLYLSTGARERAADELGRAGLGETHPLIALAPGASYPTKRWPPDHFSAAAKEALDTAGNGGGVAILGAGHDRETVDEVMRGLARRNLKALDLSGRLGLMESAAVIERADLVLSNDSGLMHMADALDRPLVAVFGPTSRELGFYPLGPRARVIELDMDCRPCTLHGDKECPRSHHKCMWDLLPSAVANAAAEVMAPPESS